jgi:hypothetical protein
VKFLFLGLDFYGENSYYNTEINISNLANIQIQNCIVDEIKVDEEINDLYNSTVTKTEESSGYGDGYYGDGGFGEGIPNIVYKLNYNKDEWGYDTVLLSLFTNETLLEAGNINNNGVEVEYIRFKKRKADSLVWQTISDISFNSNNQLYSIIDRLVQSTEQYEFACVPLTSGIEGRESTVQIQCDFEGLWLVDKTQGIQFYYDLEYGEIENVTQVAVHQPLQSLFPYVQTSATDYHKSSISATIISADTLNRNTTDGSQINIRQERLLRESIFAFLKNRKPKILKDGNGRYYMVMILGSPREKPMNELQGAIVGTQFDWIEVGDAFDNDTLKSANLV